MIPNAKMEAFEKAPPTKASNRPRTPLLALSDKLLNLLGSIPGKTIKDPILYIKSNKMVKVILLRNSSMLQIFFNVVMNFFTDDNQFIICKKVKNAGDCVLQISENYLTISTVPPAASMADLAFSLTALTLKV